HFEGGAAMTCPNALTLSMHADRALPAEQAAAVTRHLQACRSCSAAVAALEHEAAALRRVLQSTDADVPIPPIERPLSVRVVLAAAAAATATAALVGSVWSGAAAAVPAPLRWLNPTDPAVLLELLSGLFFYFTREGNAMIASMAEFAAGVVLAGLIGWAMVALLRRNAGTAALLSLLVLVAALPRHADAVEVRRGE